MTACRMKQIAHWLKNMQSLAVATVPADAHARALESCTNSEEQIQMKGLTIHHSVNKIRT